MGTIANKLSRILQTKKDIQKALVRNGKYVPDKLPFRYYPDLIDNMNINGLVGMYYGKGLTNDELSKDPTWYDTSGNGNDLKFKNFAWKLDSGAGIYVYDFTRWNYNIGGLTSIERTGSKIQIKAISNALTGNIHDEARSIGYNYNFKIRVTGIKSGNKVSIRKGTSSIFVNITQDGVYYINTTVEEDWDQKMLYIFANSYGGPDINLIIEQIPDYEGAICFNGIDDCAICDNFPILTKEKGYTVMALRKWLTFPRTKPVALASKRMGDNLGAFLVEKYNSSSNPELAISFGLGSGISINNDIPFVYQTSNSYNSTIINTGDQEDTNIFYVGGSYTTNGLNFYDFGNVAIYALCIIDHDTSDAEREIVINKWKQYYPELFFDQAWTITGKTNDDDDRATVKNLTGNGNNLVLSNFAFAEDSGYGLYHTSFYEKKNIQFYSKSKVSFSKAQLDAQQSNQPLIILPLLEEQGFKIKIKVNGLKGGVILKWGWINSYVNITEDGIHILDKPENNIRHLIIDFDSEFDPNHIITIEQIPDYEGYLVTDGVDDNIQSSSFELGKDWTMVGNWILLQDTYKPAGVVKSPIFYIYNNVNGMVVYLKSSSIQNKLPETKSLYAVCSDGKVYDNDWNEYQLTIGTVSNFLSNLRFGVSSDGTKFTKIAFKNSAIYNDKVLTKDQCIKAYNYLQTFKAK